MFTMNNQSQEVQGPGRREKMEKKRQRAKEKYQSKQEEEKPLTKQDIRKEKNRLAAQKSRDRKQEYLEAMETENRQLKTIISLCERCSQAHHQITYSQSSSEEMQDNGLSLHNNESQEDPILLNISPPTFSPSLYLRHEEDSNSSHVSKYFWFCVFLGVVCVAHFAGGNEGINAIEPFHLSPRINFEVKHQDQISLIEDQAQALLNSRLKNSLMSYSSKQCTKCLQCFRNMTNKSTSLTPVTSSTTNTNQSLTANSTKKILFCKSKAFFFKKIYKALQKIERPTVPTGEIGKLRASGKMLAQFMDKDCFTDSAIDEDQMYDLEFTVAIMELTTVKQGKALNLTRNFEVIQ